jgi:hypothetical protein
LYDDDRFTVPLEALAAVTVRLIVTVSLRLPDFPVIVRVDGPAAAEAAAASVRMQVFVVEPELNDPTTPLGRTEVLNVTVLAKPFCGVNVRVLLPVAPCAMLRAVGEPDNVNVGGGAMVSAIATLLVRVPDVPAIVTVAVAAAAALAAVKVTTLVWLVVMAPKVAVTPDGRPEAASATVPLKPFSAVIAIVLAPLAPGLRLTLAGVAETVKLGGAVTVIVIVALLVAVPAAPVTVRVAVPGAALAATLNVSVLVRVVAAGLNVAVTPAGRPVTEKMTVPVKVVCGVTVIVLVPLPPCGTLRLAGDGAIV